MLATCGNDSLIKLWKIIIMEEDIDLDESTGSSDPGALSYRERRQFAGHGGNVMCVRFSPVHGEILGSVATDRTARLWSVVSILYMYIYLHTFAMLASPRVYTCVNVTMLSAGHARFVNIFFVIFLLSTA